MGIFDLIFNFFNFINNVIQIVLDAIDGIETIFVGIIECVLKFTYILPYPLYPCFVAFCGVYFTILVYKLIRKGG